MNNIHLIIALLIMIGMPVGIFLIKSNLRWKKIKDKADEIKSEKFHEIILAIEKIGQSDPTAAILVKDAESQIESQFVISIPNFLDSPWSGKTIKFEVLNDLPIDITNSASVSVLGNDTYRAIPAPRIKLKNGKAQNMWSLQKYISVSPELKKILSPIDPKHQAEALNYILGPFVRVLGGIQWAQTAEYPKCNKCNGKMTFLLQISGLIFPKTVSFDIHESEIYVFSCIKHQDEVKKVIQFY